MVVSVFREREFLVSLRDEMRDSALFDFIDDEQIRVLDRPPQEEDVYALNPPGVLIMGLAFEAAYGLGGKGEVEPYPVIFYWVAETWDAADDSDRWTDASEGAAVLRRKGTEAVLQLGSGADGRFNIAGAGHEINWALPGASEAPESLAPDGGNDISVAPQVINYDLTL